MTTYLYSILATGSERMAQADPHGWTLTLISVSVVFLSLIVLYFLYNLSGNIFSGKFKRKARPGGTAADADVAAAIALALDAELGGDDAVAAAVALHLYLSDSVHDVEPNVITIRRTQSAWKAKERNFRKSPR